MRMSPLLLVLYSLPDALCQLFGVQRLDDALGLAAHEAGVVDDAGRTLYLAHQHEGSEKQADQDGCEKDGEKLDDMPNREESFFMMQTPFIAQEISRFPTIIMYFRERFKFGNG